MENKLKKLHKQIIPAFSAEVLASLPEHEANDYRRYKLIPQQLLVNAPWNYKEENQEVETKLANNIKNQGQTENINVRPLETGYFQVGNGNHRNSVFERQGREFVLCCVHENISEAEFKRRCIEQNETRFGGTNNFRLSELIKELAGEIAIDELALTMPYTEDELQGMIDAAMQGLDTEGEEAGTGEKNASLMDKFIIPPFSIFDTRRGYWQERKRQWLSIGIQSELGRGAGLTMGEGEEINHPTLNYYREKNKKDYALTFKNQNGLMDIMKKKPKPNATPGGRAKPSMRYSEDKARGDGAGRPIKN